MNVCMYVDIPHVVQAHTHTHMYISIIGYTSIFAYTCMHTYIHTYIYTHKIDMYAFAFTLWKNTFTIIYLVKCQHMSTLHICIALIHMMHRNGLLTPTVPRVGTRTAMAMYHSPEYDANWSHITWLVVTNIIYVGMLSYMLHCCMIQYI